MRSRRGLRHRRVRHRLEVRARRPVELVGLDVLPPPCRGPDSGSAARRATRRRTEGRGDLHDRHVRNSGSPRPRSAGPSVMEIALRDQFVRSTTAILRQLQHDSSGSCHPASAAAWSPPRTRKSSWSGASSCSCAQRVGRVRGPLAIDLHPRRRGSSGCQQSPAPPSRGGPRHQGHPRAPGAAVAPW